MVKNNRNDKNDFTKVGYKIKPDIILFTHNKMLPTLKFLPQKMFPKVCSFPNVKPIIQLSKHKNRPTLSFLQSPSHDFQNKNQHQWKVNTAIIIISIIDKIVLFLFFNNMLSSI